MVSSAKQPEQSVFSPTSSHDVQLEQFEFTHNPLAALKKDGSPTGQKAKSLKVTFRGPSNEILPRINPTIQELDQRERTKDRMGTLIAVAISVAIILIPAIALAAVFREPGLILFVVVFGGILWLFNYSRLRRRIIGINHRIEADRADVLSTVLDLLKDDIVPGQSVQGKIDMSPAQAEDKIQRLRQPQADRWHRIVIRG
jgi:hypothetical protein